MGCRSSPSERLLSLMAVARVGPRAHMQKTIVEPTAPERTPPPQVAPPSPPVEPPPVDPFGGGNGGGPPERPKLKKLRIAFVAAGLSFIAVISTVFGMMMAVASDIPDLE